MRKNFINNLFLTMRPKQWTKNLVIFAGIIFAQKLFTQSIFLKVLLAFFVFCLLSGVVYIINDLKDIDNDRKHPKKKFRPLASGDLTPSLAFITIIILTPLIITSSYFLSKPFFLIASIYFLLMIFYTFYLKNIVILDVLTIALGFLLRAVAGVVVISVSLSPWLVICTLLLALFLALSKRRHELVLLEDNAVCHRRILEEYSPKLLDQMISLVTASTVMAYALYTMSPETIEKFHTDKLIYTVPFVLYGIFRYLYLVYKKEQGGYPEKIFLTDLPTFLNIVLWGLTVGIIIYL
ncbi:MAG: decaprenyl-phosphate phosphoribosyltransferase [bacterium]